MNQLYHFNRSQSRFLLFLACLAGSNLGLVFGFIPGPYHPGRKSMAPSRVCLGSRKQKRASDSTAVALAEEEEKPAGVVGAEFFGGNKQKEELYDPLAEAQAGADDEMVLEDTDYNRFEDSNAFNNPYVAKVASNLQSQFNSYLYEDSMAPETDVTYSPNLVWETSMSVNGKQKKSKTPLDALQNGLEFYKRIDLAIVAGTMSQKDNTIELQWELSLVWPIFWEARVLLTGTSKLTIDELSSTITKQIDSISNAKDMLSGIAPQVVPRFWDFYHIGMTPSAEVTPRLNMKKSIFSSGPSIFEIPARLVATPTMIDVGDREDGNAQAVPNHAFSCVIKTMGSDRQIYVPTSPLQVQIMPSESGQLALKWSIPLAVEFQSNIKLPLPGPDAEALPGSNPQCTYEFQQRRKVATIQYAGDPQDVEIAKVRKNLYDSVVKSGLKPKLDETGRPQFFFLQNSVKACYTEEGLGMCVYEWRPSFARDNEVGIELELS